MTFAHVIHGIIFYTSTHFGAYKLCRVVYVKIYSFHLKLTKTCQMLGDFKCDQHVFMHLFRKKLIFDINNSTEFLSAQMRTFLANLFQSSLSICHARR